MNGLQAFFKTRALFAHRRIWVFWLVALIVLAAPWLWLMLTDQDQAPAGIGGPAGVEHRK